MVTGEHDVYFEHNYLERLIQDIDEATALIVFHSGFIGLNQMIRLRDPIRRAIRRGVRVCAFLQDPKYPPPDTRVAEMEYCINKLARMGVHVTLRREIHEKIVVLDERIGWEGSLNPLSHDGTKERFNRWQCKEKIAEIIASHLLDTCRICRNISGFCAGTPEALANQIKQIGEWIACRRKYLGVTQVAIAERLGLSQKAISVVESGKCKRLDRIVAVCLTLRMGLRPLAWFMLPSIDAAVPGVAHDDDRREAKNPYPGGSLVDFAE